MILLNEPVKYHTLSSVRQNYAEDKKFKTQSTRPESMQPEDALSQPRSPPLSSRTAKASLPNINFGCSFKPKLGWQHPGNNSASSEGEAIKCGEDALFFSRTSCTMGVYDGVGGWVDLGVDPSLVSSKLMQASKQVAESSDASIEPRQILQQAYDDLVQDKSISAGSSTACVLMFKNPEVSQPASLAATNQACVLHYANLGDSGFIVLRNYEVVFRSELQHHGGGFNPPPYQLAVVPPQMRDMGACDDRPEMAACAKLPLIAGDMVILGSDGLFDNLTDVEIVDIVKWKCMAHASRGNIDVLPQEIAQDLVTNAWNALRKPDDISVVVAIVNGNDSVITDSKYNNVKVKSKL